MNWTLPSRLLTLVLLTASACRGSVPAGASPPSTKPEPIAQALTSSGPPQALLVVNVASPLSSGDTQLQSRLGALGFSPVSVVTGTAVSATDCTGKAVVVISESVTDSATVIQVGTKLKTVAVPVVVLEPNLFDDMGMTTTANLGVDTTTRTQVTIVTGGHPMTAGLASGAQTIVSTAQTFGYGVPASTAEIAATTIGSTTRAAIFGYKSGVAMASGTAPARRVGWFASNATVPTLNANGWKLFDAAVNWAARPTVLVTASTTLTASETVLKTHLESLNLSVQPMTAASITATTTGLPQLIVIPDSGTAGTLTNKLVSVAVPILCLQAASFTAANLKMAGTTGTLATQTKLDIVKAGHPLAGGLTGSGVVVTPSTQTFEWGGTLGTGAVKVATINNDATKATIFAYPRGAALTDGTTAAARRVGWWASAGALTSLAAPPANAWTLFDAAVKWAQDGVLDATCESKADGFACNDGNACTQSDTCVNQECVGSNPKVCTASDQCHTAGTCNPADGTCSNPAKANGVTCNDSNACTQTDTCQAGTCTGGNPVICTASDQCHGVGVCNSGTGVCSNPALANGTSCNDGNSCTQTDTCQSGTCTGANPVVCVASDQCHAVGVCTSTTGLCSNPAKTNGTTCSDSNSCTQTDTCQSGTCTGANPVVCVASDQCHAVGVCNSTTGLCSNPAKTNGTTCSDGSNCTQTDTCQSGTCTGGNPVVCTALDQCHTAGTCNTGTGVCSNPAKSNGATCTDGNACTTSDSCQNGTCVGASPVVCTASDQCHGVGTCNTSTGSCSNPSLADGTGCNDGNACTRTDACQAGSCVGANPVTCTAQDSCHVVGTCNQVTGTCSNPAKPDNTACDDGNRCTQTDTCQSGTCTGASPVVCGGADQCHSAGVCDPLTGTCSGPSPLANGTMCNDQIACTTMDTCTGGQCTGNAATCTTGLDMDPGDYDGGLCLDSDCRYIDHMFSVIPGMHTVTAPGSNGGQGTFVTHVNVAIDGTLTDPDSPTDQSASLLYRHFSVASGSLMAKTADLTVNFTDDQGRSYAGWLALNGVGYLTNDANTVTLLRGRSYAVEAGYTMSDSTSPSSQLSSAPYGLTVNNDGTAVTVDAEMGRTLQATGTMTLNARMVPVQLTFNGYNGTIVPSGSLAYLGMGVPPVLMLRGRNYGMEAWYTEGGTDFSGLAMSRSYYSFKIPVDGTDIGLDSDLQRSLDASPPSGSVANVSVRVTNVVMNPNGYPNSFCVGNLGCSSPGEIWTQRLMTGRTYRIQGGGTFIVEADGTCPVTSVPIGSNTILLTCGLGQAGTTTVTVVRSTQSGQTPVAGTTVNAYDGENIVASAVTNGAGVAELAVTTGGSYRYGTQWWNGQFWSTSTNDCCSKQIVVGGVEVTVMNQAANLPVTTPALVQAFSGPPSWTTLVASAQTGTNGVAQLGLPSAGTYRFQTTVGGQSFWSDADCTISSCASATIQTVDQCFGVVCDDGDPCTADSCDSASGCQHTSPNPTCVAAQKTSVHILVNGYAGFLCVDGIGCNLDQYDLPRGTYSVSATYTSDSSGSGASSLGTLTVTPSGSLVPGNSLDTYLTISGTTLTANTRTITVDFQGYNDYLIVGGVSYVDPAIRTATLLVGRRYSFGVLNTVGLDGVGALPAWSLELNAAGDAVILHDDATTWFDPPVGLALKAKVTTVSFDLKNYPGWVSGRGIGDIYGVGTTKLFRGRRYNLGAPWAYNLNSLTSSIGDNDYPLVVNLDGTVRLIGDAGSFVVSGSSLTARVVDVRIDRSQYPDGLCLGRIDCVESNEPIKTLHMLAARRYEIPGGYQTPPVGQLLTVPAEGLCSPNPVIIDGHPVGVECNVPDGECAGHLDSENFPCEGGGDVCAGVNKCVAGLCNHGPPMVVPKRDCMIGSCDPEIGATYVPDVSPETEGGGCEGATGTCAAKTCQAGSCEVNTNLPLMCNPDLAHYLEKPTEDTPAADPTVGLQKFNGTLTGQLSVGPSGAAMYTVPISIPPGIGGMAPNLSLVYNSQGGDGIAGQGWELSGLSTIYRCPMTRVQDGAAKPVDLQNSPKRSELTATNTEGICIDGKRLLQRSPGVYYTENEDFSTVTDLATTDEQLNSSGFVVLTKSGEVRYYGHRSDARVVEPGTAGHTRPMGLMWMLDRVMDPWGNYYDIHYNDDRGAPELNDLSNNFFLRGVLVTSISYTGNAGNSSSSTVSPANVVEFLYDSRPRPDVRYTSIAAVHLPKKYRLQTIKTELGKYKLGYFNDDPTHLLPSRLKSIDFSVGEGMNEVFMKGLTFGWDGGGYGWSKQTPELTPDGYIVPTRLDRPAENKSRGTQFVDLDNDGLVDFVQAQGGVRNAWRNTGQKFVPQTDWALRADLVKDDGTPDAARFADMDGDGILDLIANPLPPGTNCNLITNDPTFDKQWLCKNPAPQVWLNKIKQGIGWQSANLEVGHLVASRWDGIDLSDSTKYSVADMDGDGRADLVLFGPPDTNKMYVFFNKESGWSWNSTPDYDLPIASNNYPQNVGGCVLTDVNRDGLPDIKCPLANPDPYAAKAGVYPNTGNPAQIWGHVLLPGQGDFPFIDTVPAEGHHFGDIDGNALYDELVIPPLHSSVSCDMPPDPPYLPCDPTNPTYRAGYTEPTGRALWLGTGNGYSVDPDGFLGSLAPYLEPLPQVRTYGQPDVVKVNHIFAMVDINADGLVDFVVNHPDGGELLVNAGTSWVDLTNDRNRHETGGMPNVRVPAVPFDGIDPVDPSASAAFLDINGDGVTDVVRTHVDPDSGQTKSEIWLNNFKPPVIKTFPAGLAEASVVSYAVITSQNRGDFAYSDSSTLHEGATFLSVPLRVVAEVASEDGSATRTMGSAVYSYWNLRGSATGRGPQGFEGVEVFDRTSQTRTTTIYAQAYPYTGLVLSVSHDKKVSTPGGTAYLPLSTTSTTYCDALPLLCTEQPVCTAPTGPAGGGAYPRSTDAGVFVYPLVISEVSSLYGPIKDDAMTPLPSGPVQTVNTESRFCYDTMGNPLVTTVAVDSNGEKHQKKIENTYGPNGNTRERRLGKVTHSMVSTVNLTSNPGGTTQPCDTDSNCHVTEFDYQDLNTIALPPDNQQVVVGLAVSKKRVEPNGGPSIELHTAYGYDAFGNVTTTTECQSRFSECVFGATNPANLTPTSDPLGPPFRTTTVSYDPAAFQAPVGANLITDIRTLYGQDGRGRFPVKSTNAAGHTEYYVYDPLKGVVVQQTGPNGVSSCYEYDGFGRKVVEKARCGEANLTTRITSYSAPASGVLTVPYAVVTVTEPPTGATSWTYSDVFGRTVQTQVRSFNGGFFQMGVTTYDAQGRIATQTKPRVDSGVTASYAMVPKYDPLGRNESVRQELGPIDGTTANAQDTLTTTFDGSTATTSRSVTVDAQTHQEQTRAEAKNFVGQVASVTEAGKTVKYLYDLDGNLTDAIERSDSDRTLVHIEYDKRGRKMSTDDADMGKWKYTYDGFGDLLTQTDAKIHTTTMTYDVLGRITTKADGPGTTAQWVYDIGEGAGIGKLAAMVSAPESKLTDTCAIPNATLTDGKRAGRWFKYKSTGDLDEVSECVDGTIFKTNYEYDAAGRQSLVTYPDVGGKRLGIESVYTTTGYLFYLRDSSDHLVYWAATATNAMGQVTVERTRNGVDTVSNRNSATGWLVDSTSTAHADLDKVIQHWAYRYDEVGNLLGRDRYGEGITSTSQETFEYDTLKRLTKAEVKIGPTYDATSLYEYDAAGNLTKKDNQIYTYTGCGAGPHAVCTVGGGTAFTYDDNGNMHTDGDRTVDYSAANKPIRISKGTDTVVAEFVYGADGNRIVQTLIGSESAGRTVYVGLGATGKSLYERTTRADGTIEHAQFIYAGGAHGGNAFAIRTVTESNSQTAPPVTKYYHFDHLGSVTAMSDELGRVVVDGSSASVMGYDAWGARREPDGHLATAPLKQQVGRREFTSHETIPDVGIVNMNGRVYDPALGRFLSPDPNVQFVANLQSYNRYSYVLNNPLRYSDPSGYFISGLFDTVVNLGIAVAGVAICAGTGGSGCGVGFALIAAAYNTTSMISAGASFDQIVAVNVVGAVGGLIGGAIGGQLGGDLLGQMEAGALSGAITAALSTSVFGGDLGRNVLIGAAAGAASAAIMYSVQYGIAVSQASAEGAQGGNLAGGGRGDDVYPNSDGAMADPVTGKPIMLAEGEDGAEGRSGSASDSGPNPKRNTPDQEALIDLAKGAKQRGGVTGDQAETLKEWGKEYGVPTRGPESHPDRPYGKEPHIHVGPVDHINVNPAVVVGVIGIGMLIYLFPPAAILAL